jgi:hypothetical protein
MRRYRQVLAVAVVIIFLSGVDLYLLLAEYTRVRPRDWVALFGVLLLPLIIHRLSCQDRFKKELGRIALWSLAFLAISVVWYSFSPSDVAVLELSSRLLSVCFLCLAALLFITPDSRKAAGIAAIVVVLITVVINVLEMVQPDWFLMGVTTRSSGLYVNANRCGAAMVIGMIAGSPLVPRRMRLSFYLLVGAGVAMTFSRSTTIGWLIAASIMLAFDSTKARAREFGFGCLVAATLLLALLQGAVASGLVNGLAFDNDQSNRLSFFTTLEASDGAALERMGVASKAWGMFLERPLLGNGLASTLQWSEQASTHNMFLSLMVDHGVFGAFILPALIICVLLGRRGAAQGSHWAFCMFALWYAFFSHNILEELYFLLAYAFFAMGGTVEAQGVPNPLVRASRTLARPTAGSFQSVVGAQ